MRREEMMLDKKSWLDKTVREQEGLLFRMETKGGEVVSLERSRLDPTGGVTFVLYRLAKERDEKSGRVVRETHAYEAHRYLTVEEAARLAAALVQP